MSTSEPTFVTPSFHVNDAPTRAVCTMLDSSGPTVHGGVPEGLSIVHPTARSPGRNASARARRMSPRCR
jgi:hypothetical protein